MGKRLDILLSEQDRLGLEQVVRKSSDLRARERAKTLLLLYQHMLSRVVAKVQDFNICTLLGIDMAARQAAQRLPEQTRPGRRLSPAAMGTRETTERHWTAATPCRGARRVDPG